MTNDEKFTAIVERIKAEDWLVEENMISVMVILNYLDKLQELGLVECPFNMTPLGKNIAAICEEFDWQPTDAQIKQFITEMVEDKDAHPAFDYMIKAYRDDREKLLDDYDRFNGGD